MGNPRIKPSIFGKTLSQKDAAYNEIVPYLMDVLNRGRLGLSAVTEVDDADNRLTAGWKINYPLSINVGTRNKNNIDDRNGDGIYIEDKLMTAYGEIPEKSLTASDRNILRIPIPKAKSKKSKIEVSPIISVKNMAGGWILFINRRDSDSTYASRHPDSDGVEIFYAFDVQPAAGEPWPLNVFSTRARFSKDFSGFVGKKLYGVARWKNTKEPEKSGPVSTVFSITIGS